MALYRCHFLNRLGVNVGSKSVNFDSDEAARVGALDLFSGHSRAQTIEVRLNGDLAHRLSRDLLDYL